MKYVVLDKNSQVRSYAESEAEGARAVKELERSRKWHAPFKVVKETEHRAAVAERQAAEREMVEARREAAAAAKAA